MRDTIWRMGLTLTALAALMILGPNVSCSLLNRIVEQVRGQTPQAQVARYLRAIAEGDRQAALALWPIDGSPDVALQARRTSVTDELLAYGPRLEYQILDTVWWRTCCEPGMIDDPSEAGGACVRVSIHDKNLRGSTYLFGLLVPGGYWGSAAGHPVRQWVIVDLYPEGATPLAWPWR